MSRIQKAQDELNRVRRQYKIDYANAARNVFLAALNEYRAQTSKSKKEDK